MAYLGNYYAEKILGATDLAMFEKTGKPELKTSPARFSQKNGLNFQMVDKSLGG